MVLPHVFPTYKQLWQFGDVACAVSDDAKGILQLNHVGPGLRHQTKPAVHHIRKKEYSNIALTVSSNESNEDSLFRDIVLPRDFLRVVDY